ncbi:hypothetical protein [Shouchella xiaoxiensis]|uniref:hypothetical protein n=1 Tax=Shouchella xiaoxiensis TaxID=766895 RepID=UPI0009DF9356
MDFPTIHTNFWDGVIAIPCVLLLTQLLKKTIPIKGAYVPTIATVIGLLISIFISHPHQLHAGLFMGFVYGSSAVGTYASLKTSWRAFRSMDETT